MDLDVIRSIGLDRGGAVARLIGSVRLFRGNSLNPQLDFAVPFEEDDKDPRIWFLDHNYHESMFSMFKRINGMLFRISQSLLGLCNVIDSGVLMNTSCLWCSQGACCWLVQHWSKIEGERLGCPCLVQQVWRICFEVFNSY